MNRKILLTIIAALLLVSIASATDPVFVNLVNNQVFNISEDENFTFFVEGNDTESEFPLNFSDTSKGILDVFNMSNFNNTHALINFTPLNADVGFYEFFVVVEDTADEFDTIRIKFNISNTNDPPNITSVSPDPGNFSVVENDSAGFTLNQAATDPDVVHGDILSTEWRIDGINQSSEDNFTYLPGFCDAGPHNITIIVTDLAGLSDNRTWNISVNNSNRLPFNNGTLQNQSWSEDTNLTNIFDLDSFFQENDSILCSGTNNDTLTFTASGNSSISIIINSTSHQVTLFPDVNFFGQENITFTLSDGINSTSGNTIVLNVTNVNDAPSLATISNQSLAENVSYSFTVTATDPDNVVQSGTDNITFYDNASLFNINAASGLISFIPSPSDVGTHYVNITVGDGTVNDSQVAIFIVQSNNPPVLDPIGNQTATEASLFYYDVNASDPDNDSIAFSENSTLFAIGISNGVISFTPTNDDVGNFSINITVNDSKGRTDSEVFTLTILNINNEPVLNPIGNFTHTVGKNYTINVTASDADSDTLTYTDNATFFNITKVSNTLAQINYTPQTVDIGNHTINITVNDSLLTSSFVFWIDIISNVSPTLNTIGNQSLSEDSIFNLNLTAEDRNEDNLTFGSNSTLFNITYFNISQSSISFTPTINEVGIHSIKFNVTDGIYVENETVIFNITAINDIPFFSPAIPDFNATESVLFTYDINATDEENATLTYSDNASFFTIDSSTGLINFTPGNSDVGSHNVSINVSDGVNVNTTYINFTVFNFNNAPNITAFTPNSSNVSVKENSSIAFTITVTDLDNTNLTYSWKLNGTERNTSNNWTYSPDFTESGYYNLTVIVSDGSLTDSNTWNLTVNNTNRAATYGIIIQTNQSDFSGGTLEQTNATRESGNITLGLQNSTHFYSFGNYTSSAIDLKAVSDVYEVIYLGLLTVKRTIPSGTNITVRTRSSEDASNFDTYSNFSGLSTFQMNSTQNRRYLQYNINFTTNDTTVSPAIEEVQIQYIIPNFTGDEDTVYLNWIDLDNYFSDPDGNTLKYNVTKVSNIDVEISNVTNKVTLTPTADFFGTEYIVFTANDSELVTQSNNNDAIIAKLIMILRFD